MPQDNLPDWLWISLAAVAWGAVIYIYVWMPWMKDRRKRKLKEKARHSWYS